MRARCTRLHQKYLQCARSSRKVFGPLAYLMSAVKVLGEKPPKMKVICDDGREEEGVCMIAGNGSLYGGQLKLFRKADNADEVLDALVFTEAGYKLVLDSVKGIATGAIDLGNSSVKYLQARSFRVECDREVPLEADGEYLGRGDIMNLEPAQRKLRVIAPENPKERIFDSVLKTLVNIPRKNIDQ